MRRVVFFYVIICLIGVTMIFIWSGLFPLTVQKPKFLKRIPHMKYVLQWTSSKTEPFVYMGREQENFIKRNCSVTNCFITHDRYIFGSIKEFDVILFHGPEVVQMNRKELPRHRSANQTYIFVSAESSNYYPVKKYIQKIDKFFNLTWTYKLSSDIYFGYVTIRNRDGKVIGPNTTMHWMDIDDMLPINDETKSKLKHKKIAAAWFVSNCYALSRRERYVTRLKKRLNKFNMTVDIFGKCGNKKCPRNMKKCFDMIQTDYYFYLSFENSFSDDYVTEKLLSALQNYAVPIVYGTANYTRFMPKGIYFNAMEYGVENLVTEMVSSINNKSRYYDYFKWHNHYSYHRPDESPESDIYCNFCKYINKPDVTNNKTVFNFTSWWNA